MKTEPFVVSKLTPAIGAEIEGIDLTRALDDECVAQINDVLRENLVIFFKNQNLTPAQHKALGARFGKLHIHPAPLGTLDGDPEVIIVAADENSQRIAGEVWHSDVSCDVNPPMGSILHIKETPPLGGDTLFANMYAAYADLSSSMQRFLQSLTAVHDGRRNYDGRQTAPSRNSEYPRAEHPVVRTHPVTGRNVLFVNRMFTTHIVQLKDSESAALLDLLYRHIERPEFQCRFRWQPNSVAFWDNRCVQHQALWDYYPNVRYGHRVTIAGDKPFLRD